MIRHPPAPPSLQVTAPPVVHPEPHQEVRRLVAVEGRDHQAVVAGRQAQHLRHLGGGVRHLHFILPPSLLTSLRLTKAPES